MIFEKSFFDIDTICHDVEGWHNPSYRWNGWCSPVFTKPQAEIVVKIMADHFAKHGESSIQWDGDRIILRELDEETVINPVEVVLEGQPTQVWGIGDGWIWDLSGNQQQQ